MTDPTPPTGKGRCQMRSFGEVYEALNISRTPITAEEQSAYTKAIQVKPPWQEKLRDKLGVIRPMDDQSRYGNAGQEAVKGMKAAEKAYDAIRKQSPGCQ